jgi:hypothetical protein
MKLVIPQHLRPVVDYIQPYATHMAALVCCIVAGILVGLLRINVASNVAVQPDRWVMPEVRTPQIEVLPEDMVLAGFWSEQPRAAKKAAPEAPKKPVGIWRLIGTVDHGATYQAIIESEGKVKRLSVGDVLPDGANVTEILEGSISFEQQGNAQTRKLFTENKPE